MAWLARVGSCCRREKSHLEKLDRLRAAWAPLWYVWHFTDQFRSEAISIERALP